MNKNIIWAVAALLLCGAGSTRSDEFKVGLVLPMTGAAADMGKNVLAGFDAEVAVINANGGIAGMNIKPIVCDQQTQEQQAILCDRRLISGDKVDILLGNGGTPETMAALPIVEQAGVPFFAISAGTASFRPVKKWVFKSNSANEDMIASQVEFLKHKGWTRVAIIRDTGPYGADVDTLYKRFAPENGITIVANESYAPTDQDMTAQVTRIRAAKPDVIINMAANATPGALITKKIVQLGITVPVIVSVNLQTAGFVALVGDDARQIIFSGQKVMMAELPKDDPLYRNIQAFTTSFRKINPGMKLNGLSPAAVDPLIVVQAAAKGLGPKANDHAALLGALNKVSAVPGIQGTWTFTPQSHEVSFKDGSAMMRYDNGRWVAAE